MPGDALVMAVSGSKPMHQRHLIVQLDGSCKRPASVRPVGGAGAVFWMQDVDGMRLLKQQSFPLPNVSDARAVACASSSSMRLRLVTGSIISTILMHYGATGVSVCSELRC